MATSTVYDDMQLALLRGFNLGVTNIGRMEPRVAEMAKSNGLSGINDGMRVLSMEKYTMNPDQNPYYAQTRLTSYRMADMMLDSRSMPPVQYAGRPA